MIKETKLHSLGEEAIIIVPTPAHQKHLKQNYGELIELSDSWSTSWIPGVIIYEIDNGKLINSLMGV